MALKFTIDVLTGNLVLVQASATPRSPISGHPGEPMGLLLALTYAA